MTDQPNEQLTAASFRRKLEEADKATTASAELQNLQTTAEVALAESHRVPSPLAEQRATTLLAISHLKNGQYDLALPHAEQALCLTRQNADQLSAIEQACALAVVAKAFNAVGQSHQALHLILEAVAEADKLNEDDRALFDRLFGEG